MTALGVKPRGLLGRLAAMSRYEAIYEMSLLFGLAAIVVHLFGVDGQAWFLMMLALNGLIWTGEPRAVRHIRIEARDLTERQAQLIAALHAEFGPTHRT